MIKHLDVLKLSVGDEVVVVEECEFPVGTKLMIVSIDGDPYTSASLRCTPTVKTTVDRIIFWMDNADLDLTEQCKTVTLAGIVSLIAEGKLGDDVYEATGGRIGEIAYVGDELYWLDSDSNPDELVEINGSTASTLFKLKYVAPKLKRSRYKLKDIYRNVVKSCYHGDHLNYDVSDDRVLLHSAVDLAEVHTLFTEDEFKALPNTDGLKDLVEICE